MSVFLNILFSPLSDSAAAIINYFSALVDYVLNEGFPFIFFNYLAIIINVRRSEFDFISFHIVPLFGLVMRLYQS